MASTSVTTHTSAEHADTTDGHGAEVEVASHGHVVSYNPDAPSEAWGWTGSWRQFAPRGSRVLLWLFTISMPLMMIGDHVSRVEDWYLVIIAALMVFWLLRGEARIRAERTRRP